MSKQLSIPERKAPAGAPSQSDIPTRASLVAGLSEKTPPALRECLQHGIAFHHAGALSDIHFTIQ